MVKREGPTVRSVGAIKKICNVTGGRMGGGGQGRKVGSAHSWSEGGGKSVHWIIAMDTYI